MRSSTIIGLIGALGATTVLFGGAWLISYVISTGEWMGALRWVAVVIIGAVLIVRLVLRIRKSRAGEES
jgi:Flp pilus assembly protein TadB